MTVDPWPRARLLIGIGASRAPHNDGYSLASRGCGHQHDPWLAWSCFRRHDERLRGNGSGDQGAGTSRV
jgi:hypothetical protein